MNRRGWVGWIERNPIPAAVFSFLLGLSLAATGFLAAEVGVGPASPTITDPAFAGGPIGNGTTGGTTDGTDGTDGTSDGSFGTTGDVGVGEGTTGDDTSGGSDGFGDGGTTTGGTTGTSGGSTGGSAGSTSGGSGSTTGGSGGATTGGSTGSGGGTTGSTGSTGSSAGCTPDPNYTATGVTPKEIVIGQITSEVQILPQQFGPVREGLQAYIKALNARGGVCGRTIKLEHRNDQANPSSTQSQYDQLVRQVFTFVGNTSLQDGQMYEGAKPFRPRSSDNGEYLPDIGGFGLSYTRTQSPWFAGPLGSVSPTLVGGVSYKGYREELAAEGRKCTKGGLVFLQEPTGASRDQAELGAVSVREDWGFGLGPGSTQMFEQQLAASRAQYRVLINQMLNAGVDCVFTYADLQSNVNLVNAAADEGVWPQKQCASQTRCFQLIYQPFAGYDPAFITDTGTNGIDVRTFVPHLPFEETSRPAMKQYLADLKAVNAAYAPSTFSVVGYSSGAMFEELLRGCGARPTRQCMLQGMQQLQNWTPGGLTGPITPYRTSRARWDSPFGEYDFRWVFNCVNRLKVTNVGGKLEWRRTGPPEYECGNIHVARTR